MCREPWTICVRNRITTRWDVYSCDSESHPEIRVSVRRIHRLDPKLWSQQTQGLGDDIHCYSREGLYVSPDLKRSLFFELVFITKILNLSRPKCLLIVGRGSPIYVRLLPDDSIATHHYITHESRRRQDKCGLTFKQDRWGFRMTPTVRSERSWLNVRPGIYRSPVFLPNLLKNWKF